MTSWAQCNQMQSCRKWQKVPNTSLDTHAMYSSCPEMLARDVMLVHHIIANLPLLHQSYSSTVSFACPGMESSSKYGIGVLLSR